MEDTLDPADSPSRPASGGRLLAWLLLILVMAGAAAGGWWWWQQRQQADDALQDRLNRQLDALDQRLDALRSDQRSQAQRIGDAAATNRVLREELLGLGQRNALLEDSVAKLADSTRQGARALQLEQARMQLQLGSERLHIAGDVAGARAAYALAAQTLQAIDDPRLLNARQALDTERQALEALGPGPGAGLAADLDALERTVQALPQQTDAPAASQRPAWQRVLAPLVDVRPSGGQAELAPAGRQAGLDALALEFTLARAAAERGDQAGLRTALQRAGAWLPRLWPATPARAAAARQLQALSTRPVRADLPELGSTLAQLRGVKDAAPAPPAAPAQEHR